MQITSNLANTNFPKGAIIVVEDSECFLNYKSSDPLIFKDNFHQVEIAAYSESSEKKVCALEALSKLHKIDKSERNNHIVIGTATQTIESAKSEGWRALHIEKHQLLDTLRDILLKEIKTELQEEAKKPLETSSDQFILTTEEVKHGSSVNRGWYRDTSTGTKWFGKTSLKAAALGSNPYPYYSLYKEYLAGVLYNMLGVKTPTITLSDQALSEHILKTYLVNPSYAHVKRLHHMSQYVDGFVEFGANFVENYKKCRTELLIF